MKQENKYTKEQKQKAVTDYKSGKKTAKQIAKELGSGDLNLVHRWKYQFEENSKGERIDSIERNGHAADSARIIRELENEILEYQKIVAEQAVVLELLKKHRNQKSSVFAKRSSGLTDTIRQLDPKRKLQKL